MGPGSFDQYAPCQHIAGLGDAATPDAGAGRMSGRHQAEIGHRLSRIGEAPKISDLDCDGVHVGEEDMPYAEARRLLGSDRVVGVTCGVSRDRAITAAEAGADYVAFGAFFPTMTKTTTKHRADAELLRDWSETTVVPCCAIGGITQQNCGPLVEAGADFLAVIGAIWSHPKGPRAAVAEFNDRFAFYGRAYLSG
jgi:thiamine monophosphate synthase